MTPVPKRWRVTVDRAACLGSGVCAGIAARHFAVDDSGRSRPRAELVEPDPVVLDAALACPAEAIAVREEVTGRRPG